MGSSSCINSLDSKTAALIAWEFNTIATFVGHLAHEQPHGLDLAIGPNEFDTSGLNNLCLKWH